MAADDSDEILELSTTENWQGWHSQFIPVPVLTASLYSCWEMPVKLQKSEVRNNVENSIKNARKTAENYTYQYYRFCGSILNNHRIGWLVVL